MQREIEIVVDGGIADALSDALLGAGALSVVVEDANAGNAAESPLYGEPGLEPAEPSWPMNRIIFMIDATTRPEPLLEAAAATIGSQTPPITATREVGEADWVRITQAQFTPTQISERLWVVPSWHEPPDPSAITIRLDPGIAFGTGTHPTTRLCLRWLALADLAHARVLDYGCGSGILAIAAAKLGAREVVGTDIDPRALESSRANSLTNRVAARYTDPSELGAGEYDVILANILASPLIVLGPTLVSRLAIGGHIVLSGILDRQAQQVIDTYASLHRGLSLSVWDHDDGWSCVVGRRQS
ncbi:MAG: 50S ribosomal protein L11 methyltransferase [Gemmatimonadota bacterium]